MEETEKKSESILPTLIILGLIAAGIYWFYSKNNSNNNTWLGFYYPNAVYKTDALSQQSMLSNAPKFSSIQDCMNWGNRLLSASPESGFECSRSCRYDKEWSSIVCKETTKMITEIEKGGSWDF